jgi:hypothetical protein
LHGHLTDIDPSSYPGISLVSATAAMTAGTTHFSWLRPYVLHMNREIPFVLRSRIPPDLRYVTRLPESSNQANTGSFRLANLPMNERLSKTSAGGGITGPAGNEGREQSDLEVMRDDWVRGKARKAALENHASTSQTLRYEANFSYLTSKEIGDADANDFLTEYG